MTLIESVVAVGLFAMAAATIGNLLVRETRMQTWNMTRTSAITLADRELEDLRALDYARIASRSSIQALGGISYTVTTTVTGDTPAVGMKSITTVVSWTEPTGAQTYTVDAIYTAVKR